MTAATTSTMGLDRQALAAVLEEYNKVTEQLRVAHDRLEQQVRRLRDELADKNRELARRERLSALGQMAAGLAHEIRNPLGGIRLYASLLEKDLAANPRPRDLAQKISRGVCVLDGLVSDVLTFAGDIHLQPVPVDLGVLIEECLELLAPLAGRFATQAITDFQEGVTLSADAHQLRSAATNLLRNAMEAAGPHGRVSISTRLMARGRRVRLEISDTGPGIDRANIGRIFDPFFTTKDTGTGLGLATVHRIIDAHGGAIRVRNAAPHGACFEVELPVEAESIHRGGITEER
jgi:signal transduction histidine kinase